uniref:Uncharacterized protein n=1 Tax=Panagrolaimus sp. ES5 TaxID=591445 RepID=A0AC34FIX7_9BILA
MKNQTPSTFLESIDMAGFNTYNCTKDAGLEGLLKALKPAYGIALYEISAELTQDVKDTIKGFITEVLKKTNTYVAQNKQLFIKKDNKYKPKAMKKLKQIGAVDAIPWKSFIELTEKLDKKDLLLQSLDIIEKTKKIHPVYAGLFVFAALVKESENFYIDDYLNTVKQFINEKSGFNITTGTSTFKDLYRAVDRFVEEKKAKEDVKEGKIQKSSIDNSENAPPPAAQIIVVKEENRESVSPPDPPAPVEEENLPPPDASIVVEDEGNALNGSGDETFITENATVSTTIVHVDETVMVEIEDILDATFGENDGQRNDEEDVSTLQINNTVNVQVVDETIFIDNSDQKDDTGNASETSIDQVEQSVTVPSDDVNETCLEDALAQEDKTDTSQPDTSAKVENEVDNKEKVPANCDTGTKNEAFSNDQNRVEGDQNENQTAKTSLERDTDAMTRESEPVKSQPDANDNVDEEKEEVSANNDDETKNETLPDNDSIVEDDEDAYQSAKTSADSDNDSEAGEGEDGKQQRVEDKTDSEGSSEVNRN